MALVVLTCLLLIGLTTLIHYEVLNTLNTRLPALRIANRAKVLVVIFAAMFAHLLEIGLYGLALFLLVQDLGVGNLGGAGASFDQCLYFSAETYTSLGFGDVVPVGPVRLLAGIEALNGLVLIAWSASYAYVAMQQFWVQKGGPA
jgi:hypothetical protein